MPIQKHQSSIRRAIAVLLSSAGLCLCAPSIAVAQEASADEGASGQPGRAELLDVPLEELLTLESTSVAKKRQRVADSAAAVFVITQEDISRSAASTIPDLLRGVPGVEVGHQTNGGYAVSIRGFNSRLANSLLVMVDGRSQFVSTLSGVFWDQLTIPLGDIERIEVIRGPGASLWGANSSNGVINIITKHSADSGGLQTDVRAGSRLQSASLSHGDRLADGLTYRIHGSFRHDNGLVDADGKDIGRRWQGGSAGARLDWEPDERDSYTVQAEYGEGDYDTPFQLPDANLLTPGYRAFQTENGYSTFSVLGRWTRRQSAELDWTLQAQYSKLDRTEFGEVSLDWQLADIDFGLHWKPNAIHDINVGLGARILHDTLHGTRYLAFPTAPSATDRWLSGYVQDDISLVPDRLRLTLGTKIEYNNFTGFELQPNARLFLKASHDLSLWAAVTRAVRTPSRFERSAFMALTVEMPGSPANPYPAPIYPTLNGVPKRKSEKLTAIEAGVRLALGGSWALDAAVYLNHHHSLTVLTPTTMAPLFAPGLPFPLGMQVNLDFAGRGKARTWGTEATVGGNVLSWWKASINYSRFANKVATDPLTGADYGLLFPLAGSPRHQIALNNRFDFGDRVALDMQLRHVSSLYGGGVPAYTSLDLKLAYRVSTLELSILGENLLKARRLEYYQPLYPAPEAFVPRSVSGQIRYRF